MTYQGTAPEGLARRIEAYWLEHEARVVVWLVPLRGGAGRLAFGITRNLSQRGLPSGSGIEPQPPTAPAPTVIRKV